MQIILGKCGFCNGVASAINTAECAAKKNGTVYSLHPIIHNKSVVADMEKKGVYSLGNHVLERGDTVVISAHGCDRNTLEELNKLGVNIVDATCPFVKKIHEKIVEYTSLGYKIIIIGDERHAETQGHAGWTEGAIVVDDEKKIDFSTSDKYFICVQTTFSQKRYQEIKKFIENQAKNLLKTVEFFESICYTTVGRQENAVEIAQKCDLVLVVGDKSSSNCKKLFDTASQYCDLVYFVENVTDLRSIQIKKNIVLSGILSGASTPQELTMEVFNRMSEQIVINNVDEVKEEKVEAPVEKQEKEISSMEEAMKVYRPKSYREGMRLKTSIIKVDNNGITVAIVDGNGKNDCGFISKDEAEIDGSYDPSNYKVDDEIEAIIIPKEPGSKEKAINLSKKAFDAIKLDDEKVKGILAGEEFSLACNQEIKGGLLGKIGTYTVFVPASQIRVGFVKSLADYVGKPLRLKALPPKEELDEEGNVKKPRNPKRIVASQRIILEEEKAAKEEEFWSKIYEGAIVSGKVKRFAAFGAFVSLKQMDALVHNSDLSWSKKRINDPSEVLELNKTYDFIVISADRDTGKISLGYKQLQKKPSEIAQEKYPVGTVVTGKVARLVKFGAFVELEPGIDGLVHISQINHNWIQSASEALKEGDEVEVKVMKYEDDKITLSIKELIAPPVVEVNEEKNEEVVSEKPSRSARFTKKLDDQDKPERKEKKSKRVKEENDDEPREYVSSSTGVTLGDLFKNINLGEDND